MMTLHPNSEKLVQQLAANGSFASIISGPNGADFLAAVEVMRGQLNGVSLLIDVANYGSAKEIRETYDLTRTRPAQPTLVVFNHADTLSVSAQNALLKLLEEPPVGYYFVLLTAELDKLLPTIVSRTQHVNLLPITAEQSEELLDSLAVSSPQKRKQLLFIGQGLPLELSRLASDEDYFNQQAELMRDARSLLQAGVYEKLKLTQRYKDNRESSATLLHYCGRLIVQTLQQKPSVQLSNRLEQIIRASEALTKNANVRLTLLKVVV